VHDALQHDPHPLPLFLDLLRRETATSAERRAAALRGLRAYQEAHRSPPRPPAAVLDREGSTLLCDHGGPPDAPPVVFVPSLINPPDVLDLDADRSLLRWMAAQGHRVLMIDWNEADPAARGLSLGGHVERRILPLLARLGQPAVLVGYCLGGTVALAAAGPAKAVGVATIAAPWRFAGYDSEARAAAQSVWNAVRGTCRATGLVPMEMLQLLFWQIDPARTVSKFERFGRLAPGSPEALAFVRLEDWSNAGAPLPFAAADELFGWLTGDDRPGRGEWIVAGAPVRPADLDCPSIEFVSLTDRIVPADAAARLRDRRDSAAGHVGMVVGRRAPTELWRDLAAFVTEAITAGHLHL